MNPNVFACCGRRALAAKVFLAFFYLLVFTIQASADAKINSLELPLGDITLKPGTALKLKSLALKINPKTNINNLQLLAIEILAKSRQGKGMIRLRIGNKLTDWRTISGNKQAFDSKQADSYYSIKIRSPDAGKGQVWQLLINGYIKIRKVILYTAKTQSLPEGSV